MYIHSRGDIIFEFFKIFFLISLIWGLVGLSNSPKVNRFKAFGSWRFFLIEQQGDSFVQSKSYTLQHGKIHTLFNFKSCINKQVEWNLLIYYFSNQLSFLHIIIKLHGNMFDLHQFANNGVIWKEGNKIS